MAESFKAPVQNITATINPQAVVVVDRMSLSNFKVVEYTISTGNSTQKVRKTFKLILINHFDDITTQVFAKCGDHVSVAIDAFVVGTLVEVRFSNLESFVVGFTAARTIV